ncbi:hypothetical protein JCM11251_002260 [Rhodosporidiobolus azoricus]
MSRPSMNLVFPDRTTSGISKNADGERVVAQSRRADGSVRKELKIRPGFTPQEDVALYRSRGAVEAERRQAVRGVVPGLRPGVGAKEGGAGGGKKRSRGKKTGGGKDQGEEAVPASWDDELSSSSTSATATATATAATPTAGEPAPTGPCSSTSSALPPPVPAILSSSALPPSSAPSSQRHSPTALEAKAAEDLTPEEKEKKARALRKKLRQAEQLRDRTTSNSSTPTSSLAPAEQEKVDSIERLLRELEGLKVQV